ncbi:hypothetical protein FRC04_000993 [Tulasnella sp. 424]|nr:hypothetical protein FRC04_000993 [Tulasnella sp. 424]
MQLKLSILFTLFMSSAPFALAQQACQDINQQCGGSVMTWTWTGPTCCIDSADPTRELTCKYINSQFSVCVPTGP